MSGSSHRSKCTGFAGSKEAFTIVHDRLDADSRPFTAGPDATAARTVPEGELGRPCSAPSGLAEAIRGCRICVTAPRGAALPHEPKPVLRLSGAARLVIASQAPGVRAHASGVPFDDPSGERLRAWMGIGPELFYDPDRVIIAPMGFCFPGHDAHKGDLPPRAECRAAWHDLVFAAMPQVETILAIGHHAIRYHMARLYPDLAGGLGLSDQVKAWRSLFERPGLPRLMPMPHPSWRNSGWLKRNPWFQADLLPVVRTEVRRLVVEPPRPIQTEMMPRQGAFSPGSAVRA